MNIPVLVDQKTLPKYLPLAGPQPSPAHCVVLSGPCERCGETCYAWAREEEVAPKRGKSGLVAADAKFLHSGLARTACEEKQRENDARSQNN